MTHDPQHLASMFTSIDVAAENSSSEAGQEDVHTTDTSAAMIALMRQFLAAQDRQNELLEELVQQVNATQRQRSQELSQWKEANPDLARSCRSAAETLSRVQTEFLRRITDEIAESDESLVDGDFLLNEFVDRFGPRLAHLNGVLQVLSQLSSVPGSVDPK